MYDFMHLSRVVLELFSNVRFFQKQDCKKRAKRWKRSFQRITRELLKRKAYNFWGLAYLEGGLALTEKNEFYPHDVTQIDDVTTRNFTRLISRQSQSMAR